MAQRNPVLSGNVRASFDGGIFVHDTRRENRTVASVLGTVPSADRSPVMGSIPAAGGKNSGLA
jgi:hypothetical protein